MTLETLEQYLDGALDAPEAKAVEAAIAADEILATRIERLKAQRALRAAALSTYAPSTDESRMLAMAAIDACYEQNAQPVGRIGSGWAKKFAGIAAALAIAAISFYAGQKTAPQNQIAITDPDDRFVVVITKDREGKVLDEVTIERDKVNDYIASKTAEAQDMPTIEDGTQIGGIGMM